MHSRWQIWDFFNANNKDLLTRHEGLLALNTFDPACLKLVKDFLTRDIDPQNFHYKMASEVTSSWIEEEFQTLSLFGNTDSFFIHQAHDLSTDILEELSTLEVSGRFVLLSFENELATWKKLLKDKKIPALIIETPRFWELNKLLDFVCSYLRLPLSYEAKGWMLEAIENNLGSFYNACCLIKINFPDANEVGPCQVKELLSFEKLDQFQLASLLGRKKFQDFYQRLIVLEGDYEKMRGFFMFLQSHLIKMTDPSYLSKKTRLTNYDKDLQNTSRLWKQEELMLEIERFSRWEILCKKKESLLWHEIKLAQFRSYST